MHLRFGETVIVTLCEKGKTNLVGYALVLQRYLQSCRGLDRAPLAAT